MWVFTETGFVSAVVHHEQPDTIIVRARDIDSLDYISVLYGKTPVSTPNNDYPYRVLLSRDEYISWLRASAERLMYTNFKDRVADTRGYDYALALSEVWTAMHAVEDEGARDGAYA